MDQKIPRCAQCLGSCPRYPFDILEGYEFVLWLGWWFEFCSIVNDLYSTRGWLLVAKHSAVNQWSNVQTKVIPKQLPAHLTTGFEDMDLAHRNVLGWSGYLTLHNANMIIYMIINMHTRRIIGEGKNHCKIVSWNVSWTSWTSLSEFCWQALAYNWPTEFYRISTECCPQFTGNGVTVSRGQRVHDRPVYPDKVEGPGKGTMTWSRTMRCLLNGMKLWNNWI